MNLKCVTLNERNSKGYILHDFTYMTIWKRQTYRDTKQGFGVGGRVGYTGVWENVLVEGTVLYLACGGDFSTINICQYLENWIQKVLNLGEVNLNFIFKMEKII